MKQALLFITVLFSISVFAQTKDRVFLKWKLQPKEVLSYKTIMTEIDTANLKGNGVDFGGFLKLLGDSVGKDNQSADMMKAFSEINKSIGNTDMVTNLSENKKGVVDIEMHYIKKKEENPSTKSDSVTDRFKDIATMMNQITDNVTLRGSVNDNGSIHSFYLKNGQKNLLAVLFQLPDKEIAVGDQWALDVNLISMDENFKCDTAYKKNVATLIDLKKVGNDTIAVIKYDILEYVAGDVNNPFSGRKVKTMMKVAHNGIAEFSIDKGRWISYNAVMLLNTSGVMDSRSTKRITLSPN